MAVMNFQGKVVGRFPAEEGSVMNLLVEELEHTELEKAYVEVERKTFNPNSRRYFGGQDSPCNVKPAFANYKFSLSVEDAKAYPEGCLVDVCLHVFMYSKPFLSKAKEWSTIPETRHRLASIKPIAERSAGSPDSRPDKPHIESSAAKAGK